MSSELGAFLRARRADARLGPAFPTIGARRVPGLRREEVAAAAGISVDYYTRLEQGRETNPSDSVVNALARALRLESDAVEYLHRLRATGGATQRPDSNVAHVAARATALVDAVRPNPAYALDRLSNVVAINAEGLSLFEGFADIPPSKRNTCRYLVTDPRAPEIFVDWEEITRGAVAQLRAANAHDLDDPALQAMVADLSDQSPRFGEWWTGRIVRRRRSSTGRIRDSDGGVVQRRYEILHLPEDGLRMTLWLAANQP